MENVNPNTTGFFGLRPQNDAFGEKKKKILFVVTQSEMGGAQRYITSIAKPLATQGYSLLIAAGEGDNGLMSNVKRQMSNQIQILNVKSQKLKYLKRTPNPITAILSIREIRKLLKKEQPDVLFLCSTMAGILGSLAGSMFRSPTSKHWDLRIIYRIGGWAFNDPRPFWQKKLILFLEKFTSRFKDKIVVNSEFDLQCALKHKIAPKEKLVKLYNGINSEEINFLPKEQAKEYLFKKATGSNLCDRRDLNHSTQIELNSNKLIIGTIANFYKTKGLAFLIEAMRNNFQFPIPACIGYAEGIAGRSNFQSISNSRLYRLCRRHCGQVQLLIIGNGPERKNLEKLIEKYNLQDKVFLLGRIQEARKYLKAFDVFVLPSLKEGFPWVVLEAMAAEIPVVATKVGAVQEIIENNISGFVIKPGNPEILAKKIQDLLRNPELRNKFVQNAKEKLNQFSKEKMIRETKKVIKV